MSLEVTKKCPSAQTLPQPAKEADKTARTRPGPENWPRASEHGLLVSSIRMHTHSTTHRSAACGPVSADHHQCSGGCKSAREVAYRPNARAPQLSGTKVSQHKHSKQERRRSATSAAMTLEQGMESQGKTVTRTPSTAVSRHSQGRQEGLRVIRAPGGRQEATSPRTNRRCGN